MTRKNQLRLVASLAVAVVGAVVIELTADIEPAVSLVLTVTFIAVSLALVPRERPPWLEYTIATRR
ncbi:MAG: hypothetical protein OXH97_09370 [Chloroflexota bacterium]|nr:hypothetical protein [Chloroflexota bacterium]MYB76923.1 hypothetical protein [Chloroflexota bacterium]